MRLSDLKADLTQIETVKFVGGVYPRRHLTILASQPGTGKTWLILRHSLDVVLGAAYLTCGEELPETPGKILLFCGETGGGIIAERIKELGCDIPPENLAVYTLTTFMKNNVPISLDTPEGISTMARIVEGEKPDVVFIDTLISFRSEDESDQKSTAIMLGGLRRVAEDNNCAIVFSHHLRKRKTRDRGLEVTMDDIIGTSAFTRLCSIAYTLSRIQFSDSVLFRCVKSWWKKPDDRAFRIQNYGNDVQVCEVAMEDDSSFSVKCEKYINDIPPGFSVTISDLTRECGCSQSMASRIIKRAIEDGALKLIWQENNIKHFQKIR